MPGPICKAIECENKSQGILTILSDPTVRADLEAQGYLEKYITWLDSVVSQGQQFVDMTTP